MSTPAEIDRPRPDPYLAALGEPYEDISAIGPAQPFSSSGPTLHSAAIERLARADHADAGRDEARLGELVSADLMTPSGELTGSGRLIASALARPTGHLRVESSRGRTPLALDASEWHGQAAVVATASPAGLAEEPHGAEIIDAATTVTLDWIDVSYLPVMIASWVGLAPAWSLATEPEVLPEELILQRADDPATPPPHDADRNLRHAWEQPWHLWTMRAARVDTGRVLVNAGRAGHFMLFQESSQRPGGLVRFQPTPAASVWLDLVSYVQRAITAPVAAPSP